MSAFNKRIVIGLLTLPLLFIANTNAQPQTAPATQAAVPGAPAAPAETLEATITGLEGNVQVRAAEDQPWKPVTVGMKVSGGAEFRTGPRSAVRFTIPPDQTVTLDRLGTIKLLQAVRQANKVKTDLGMKYGRTRYDIEAAGLEHQSTIYSPDAALAVRGTKVSLYDQPPFAPEARSLTGRAEFKNSKHQMAKFGNPGKPAQVRSDKNTPAQTAVSQTRVDPKTAFSARTDAENDLLESLPTLGGLDNRAILAVSELKKLGGFEGTFGGVPPVSGPLSFDLIWIPTIDVPNPTNLDLTVRDPKGNVISAANPSAGTGSAIGTHSGDDPGTSGGGAEGVIWPLFYPAGKYTYTVTNHPGGDPVTVFLIVSLQNNPIGGVGVDPNPPATLSGGQTIKGTIKPPSSGVAPMLRAGR